MSMSEDLRRGQRTSQLNLRARPGFRAKLAEAAQASGRSLAEEMEVRVEESFAREQLFGDKASADFALLLGATFVLAGRQAAVLDGRPQADWQKDPWCFESAVFATADALLARHPASEECFAAVRDNVLRRLFARHAIRCGKTAADAEELQVKLTRADLRREGELPRRAS
jgi:hypothetical protein